MRVPDPSVSLRPLGVGEILDRAVTLCVRFFLPLATIYVVYAIPLAVVSFASTKQIQRIVEFVTAAARSGHGSPTPEQWSTAFASNPYDTLFALGAGVFAFFIAPLPTAALIEAVTAFYLGRTSSFKQAYRVALDRYFHMLGVTLLFLIAGLAVYLVVVILIFLVVFASVALSSLHSTFGIIVGGILGTVVALFLVALGLVALIAFQLAYFSCVVERASFVEAFGRSIKRVYARVGLGRTLLIGLIYGLIALGIGLVSITGAGLGIALFHTPIAASVYETIVRVVTAAFTTAYVGAFYLDLRVREEGLDLQLQTEQPFAPVSPQP